MATRKKTKKQIKKNHEYKATITGVIILFLSIIGSLKYGYIGDVIMYSATYLFGIYAMFSLIILALISIVIIFTQASPKLNGPQMLGVFMIFLSLLAYSAMENALTLTGIPVIEAFISNFNETLSSTVGGGFIGALIYALTSVLFGAQGTFIALVLILIAGIAFFTGKSYIMIMKKWFLNRKESYVAQQEIKKSSKQMQEDTIKKGTFKIFPDKTFDADASKVEEPVIVAPSTTALEKPLNKEATLVIHDNTVKKEEVVTESYDDIIFNEPAVSSPSASLKYRLPLLSLLVDNTVKGDSRKNMNHAKHNAERLINVMEQFGIKVEITEIHIGPSVTKYEIKPDTGVRINRIAALQDDIKMALAAKDIRIEAPIPGKAAVGIEIPNAEGMMVTLKEVLKEAPLPKDSSKMLVGLGRDIGGTCINAFLDKMPHLLVAGATGSGKSVCINGIIVSILMRARPDEVKLLLVDPKKVELNVYNGIPHLLAPVVTDPKKAAVALKKVVEEMERRYELFANAGARNLAGYNTYAKEENDKMKDEQMLRIPVLPYIVVIVDELADLMMVASKEVEEAIMRITQMARAAGIHLIVATQRPSTDVITGIIKANIPSRIAFAVSSSIDSRTILDSTGAERLLGKGDMLFSPMGENSPTRIQGAFISDAEVQAVVAYVIKQQQVDFDDTFMNLEVTSNERAGIDSDDPIYEEVRQFVVDAQKASASLLQRKFSLGYNRAARLIDQLEANGIIGMQQGSKPREVLVRGYHEEDIT